nr:hypothetical protein CFP56_77667 [Quercus suber]
MRQKTPETESRVHDVGRNRTSTLQSIVAPQGSMLMTLGDCICLLHLVSEDKRAAMLLACAAAANSATSADTE